MTPILRVSRLGRRDGYAIARSTVPESGLSRHISRRLSNPSGRIDQPPPLTNRLRMTPMVRVSRKHMRAGNTIDSCTVQQCDRQQTRR